MDEIPPRSSCKEPGQLQEPIFNGSYSFNTGKVKELSHWDLIIVGIVLFISVVIGIYQAWGLRRSTDIDDYLLAGRSMGSCPVGFSLLGTAFSSITLLGTPMEVYYFTTMYAWLGFSFFLVTFASTHIYHPLFYRLKIISVYEYVEMRFNKTLRTMIVCIFVVQTIAYMSLVIHAPYQAFNEMTEFKLWDSILFAGAICTVYTAMGGLKAVLWTDVVQVIVVVISLVVVLGRAAVLVGQGDWSLVWEAGKRSGRVRFDETDPKARFSMWSLVIGGYINWTPFYAVNHTMIQKVISCGTMKAAKIAMWMNFLGMCFIFYVGCCLGLYISAFYENCDPVTSNLVSGKEKVLPLFVTDMFQDAKGLPGLFIAGIFSATLSTLSSGLHSVSATIVEDLIKPNGHSEMTAGNAKKVSEGLCVLLGGLCLLMAYADSKMKILFKTAQNVSSSIAAPTFGVFSLGMFFPWANTKGAACGLLSSMGLIFSIATLSATDERKDTSVALCISNCNPKLFNNATSVESFDSNSIVNVAGLHETPLDELQIDKLFALPYMWRGPVAFTTCVVVGLIVSFITGPSNPKDINPQLLVFLCDVVFPFFFLPERIRKLLRFGVPSLSAPSRRYTPNRKSLPNLTAVLKPRDKTSRM